MNSEVPPRYYQLSFVSWIQSVVDSVMKAYRTLYELMDNPEKLQVLAKEAKVFCLLNGLPSRIKESPHSPEVGSLSNFWKYLQITI